MNATAYFSGPLAQALGWALLHLVWQATLVAGILAAALALLSGRSANARYAASCTALGAVFALFVITVVRSWDPAAAPIVAVAPEARAAEVPLSQVPVLIAAGAAEGVRDRLLESLGAIRSAFPSLVAVWLAGVTLLSARLLVSWGRARRLLRLGAGEAGRDWQKTAARLSHALGLKRAVTLVRSEKIDVPAVIGWLRPVVLIPAGALAGMTPQQVEMVLAHELAHIRRHDFFVNLLQACVETLMFYHPAVWWMSSRVRVERENCCDDLAVSVCGDPIQYARALARLEELRAPDLPVLVAASGGSLLARVRRIAAGRGEETGNGPRWTAAVVMLSILGLAAIVPSLPALAQKEEPAPKAAQSAIEVVGNEDDETVAEDEETNAEAPEPPEAELAEVEGPDVEVPDVDVDVDVDVDIPEIAELQDGDLDLDFDFDVEVPLPPGTPVAPLAPLAPLAAPGAIAPVPAGAPVPGVPGVPPAPRAAPAPTPRARMHDGDDREIGSGKLSVDQLIALRAAGVTPAYVNSMREIFDHLTVGSLSSMAAVGVTPAWVREMRAAGLEVKQARDAARLRAVDVTPEFVARVRAAGLGSLDLHEIAGLRAVGVTPEYVEQIRRAGMQVGSVREATTLRAVGVTAEYIDQMRAAGLAFDSARELAGLRAVGVSADWLRDMRAAGVKIDSVRDATSLRATGVTPALVKRLAAAGYSNLSARELARLAAAGIDDDFIRDLQKYREKN